ncbi:MAG: mono/diheme cytochrome c family protein [Planctomycetota bacterium]|jgi:mono/diheme cytochrome c family protein
MKFGFITILVMVLLYVLNAAMTPDLSTRNHEIFTEMVYSKANESFSHSTNLPGGLTQQPLVEGVVTRGELPFAYGLGNAEAVRAGRELMNPFSADDADALEDGRRLYGIYCTLCHDPGGNGRGSVVEHGMLPPPSLHAVRATSIADGEIFHILTRGQGNMASYAAQMTPPERWQVILFIRQLQEENK